MGNTIFIQEKKVHYRPLHNRLEAIQRLKPLPQLKAVDVLQERQIS